LVSLKKRMLQADIPPAFHNLTSVYKQLEDLLFTQIDMDRTRGNSFISEEGKM